MLLNKVFNNRYTLKFSKFLKYVDKYGIYNGYRLSFNNFNYETIARKNKNSKAFDLVNKKINSKSLDNDKVSKSTRKKVKCEAR